MSWEFFYIYYFYRFLSLLLRGLFKLKLLWTILIYEACLWNHLGRKQTEIFINVFHKPALHPDTLMSKGFPSGEGCFHWMSLFCFFHASPSGPYDPGPIHSNTTRRLSLPPLYFQTMWWIIFKIALIEVDFFFFFLGTFAKSARCPSGYSSSSSALHISLG